MNDPTPMSDPVPTTDVFARVVAHLESCGIAFRLSSHAPTLTSADAARERGVDISTGAKSLVVKHKDRLAVFVVPADRQLDWKKAKAVGFKGARFADPDELFAATGLTKGAVPPVGNVFGLAVFLDHRLTDLPVVYFNAGSLTDSVEMSGADLATATDATLGDFASDT
jgi:Ala-tRNA(Pro) deacylase